MNNYLIITDDPSIVLWLRERSIVGDVVTEATPENVKGRDVIGLVPLQLAALARSVTVIDERCELVTYHANRYAPPIVPPPADHMVVRLGDETVHETREKIPGVIIAVPRRYVRQMPNSCTCKAYSAWALDINIDVHVWYDARWQHIAREAVEAIANRPEVMSAEEWHVIG